MNALKAFLAKHGPKVKEWALKPAPGGVLTRGGATGLGAGGLAALGLMSGGEEEPSPEEQQIQEMDYDELLRRLEEMQK